MIHLFLDPISAQALLARETAQPDGSALVISQLRDQLPHETHFGCEDCPPISVWYREQSVDCFDDDVADAMYAAMQQAWHDVAAKRTAAIVAARKRPARTKTRSARSAVAEGNR